MGIASYCLAKDRNDVIQAVGKRRSFGSSSGCRWCDKTAREDWDVGAGLDCGRPWHSTTLEFSALYATRCTPERQGRRETSPRPILPRQWSNGPMEQFGREPVARLGGRLHGLAVIRLSQSLYSPANSSPPVGHESTMALRTDQRGPCRSSSHNFVFISPPVFPLLALVPDNRDGGQAARGDDRESRSSWIWQRIERRSVPALAQLQPFRYHPFSLLRRLCKLPGQRDVIVRVLCFITSLLAPGCQLVLLLDLLGRFPWSPSWHRGGIYRIEC